MDIVLSTLSSALPILVFGILVGAGLPAIFALGMRAWSPTAGPDGVVPAGASVAMVRKVAGGLCLAVVAAAVVVGIVYLVVTGHR